MELTKEEINFLYNLLQSPIPASADGHKLIADLYEKLKKVANDNK